jgi:PKHD-type hydroxylase
MVVKFNYYCFENAVHPKILNEMIKMMKQSKDKVKGNVEDKPARSKIRDSWVTFRSDAWLYKYTHPYVRKANQEAGWNFQWEMTEPAQLTAYTKKQHYNWHTDAFTSIPSSGPEWRKGKIRKLSSVLLLNDDFKGGEFQISYKSHYKDIIETPKFMRKAGSIIIFPGFVWHRVKPVISGTRYSLTQWHVGAPYV